MATSRQTPRVWSDAIRGSEILANWFKLGTNAVVLWLSIGMILGGTLGGAWFLEGTTSLDRRLWLHHIRNGLGIGGPIADLPDPNGSGERIQVPKAAVQRYTGRSFETVSRRVQESPLPGLPSGCCGYRCRGGLPAAERPLGHRRPAYPGDNDRLP